MALGSLVRNLAKGQKTFVSLGYGGDSGPFVGLNGRCWTNCPSGETVHLQQALREGSACDRPSVSGPCTAGTQERDHVTWAALGLGFTKRGTAFPCYCTWLTSSPYFWMFLFHWLKEKYTTLKTKL